MFKKHRIFALLTIAVLAIITGTFDGPATAQTTKTTMLGRVTDERGNAVPGAKVVAKNLDTGVPRETTTDGEGRYRLSEILPGIYEISAEGQGFRPHIQRGVELAFGRQAVVDFKLSVTQVAVEQDAPLVNTTNSAVGYLVNNRQIQQLPLNGRDVLQQATLVPGVISTGSITLDQSDDGPGTTRLIINGGRLDFNAYYLDGVETKDSFGFSPGGLGGGFLGVDALREFQVLTSGYSAEFGGASGGVINAVTKSGGNLIHGTAFEFLRNSALDARNFFDRNPRQLPFQRNQFGGSLGGPVIKNRAFLFGSFEALRRREGAQGIFNVPTQAAKQGNLTTGQAPVAPSVIPYLHLYPDPNGPVMGDTGIFVRNFKERADEDFFTVRADYKLTGVHTLTSRYTIDDSGSISLGGLFQKSLIQDLVMSNRNQYISLEEQALVSPRGVNTMRATYNRSNFRSDLPFSVPVSPDLAFIPGRQMGVFFLSGVAALRGFDFAGRRLTLNQFELNDQFVYSLGAHSVKVGGSVRRYQLNSDSAVLLDGAFFFQNPGFPSPFAQFLAGAPDILFAPTPGTDQYRGIRQSLFGLYAQDSWKATRRLTVNLGLRYEPISTPTEVNGKVANLRDVATDTAPTAGGPFIKNPSYGNLAPRIGFAFDLFGDGKTALRGGAGVFYAAITPMLYRFEISNQPPFADLSAYVGPFPNAFTSPVFTFPGGVVTSIEFDAKQPTVYQWNLNVQRELGRDLALSAGYVGSRGVNLVGRNSINVRTDFEVVNGQKFFPAGGSAKLNSNFASINYSDFSVDSYFHAFQTSLTRRFSGGLQFQTAYTYSKSIDTASSNEGVFVNGASGGFRQDPFDSRAARGLSDFDARHNFVANFLYDLPFGKGRGRGGHGAGAAGALVEGWSVGGIVSIRSGFPFNVALGFDRVGNGNNSAEYLRPNVTPNVDLSKATTGDPAGFVDPAFFQLQPAGFYGNAPRNALRGPDMKSFDVTLTKRTPITERLGTEFRVEAFNLFNRPNFAPPDLVNRAIFTGVDTTGAPILNSTFGQLTRTAISSRQIQFGLKFLW